MIIICGFFFFQQCSENLQTPRLPSQWRREAPTSQLTFLFHVAAVWPFFRRRLHQRKDLSWCSCSSAEKHIDGIKKIYVLLQISVVVGRVPEVHTESPVCVCVSLKFWGVTFPSSCVANDGDRWDIHAAQIPPHWQTTVSSHQPSHPLMNRPPPVRHRSLLLGNIIRHRRLPFALLCWRHPAPHLHQLHRRRNSLR